MKENKNNRSIEVYNPKGISKIASVLYDLNKCRWHMSIYGYRMLFALAQGISSDDLFCEYTFRKSALFKYLGVDKSNQRHDILNNTLKEIMQSGLEIVEVGRGGKRSWKGVAWITYYEFSEDKDLLNITVNSAAKPYLFAVRQYAGISPEHYLRLNSDYQTWFYPMLKKAAPIGKWVMKIDDIVSGLGLENEKSYSKECRNAVANILKNIVGIEVSEEWKQEQRLAKAERRAPRPVPWNYVRYKNGEYHGTLWGISRSTDIEVKAYAEKSGRAFDRVVFLIQYNMDRVSPGLRKSIEERIRHAAEEDMGQRQDMENRNIQVEYTEPTILPVMEQAFHSFEELQVSAEEVGLTVEEYIKVGRFVKHPNGKYYMK